MAVDCCEYNPKLRCFASSEPEEGNCENEAVFNVCKGFIRVCKSCSELDEFKFLPKKEIKREK